VGGAVQDGCLYDGADDGGLGCVARGVAELRFRQKAMPIKEYDGHIGKDANFQSSPPESDAFYFAS
jgi:hypothetical protein